MIKTLATLLVSLASAAPALAAETASALSTVPPGIVDGATAQRLVAAGARLVDVRSPGEFESGHIPGAVLLPYDEVTARAAELGSKETPIVLYCRTGRRTAIAASALQALGFTRVWDMKGMSNWPEAAR